MVEEENEDEDVWDSRVELNAVLGSEVKALLVNGEQRIT